MPQRNDSSATREDIEVEGMEHVSFLPTPPIALTAKAQCRSDNVVIHPSDVLCSTFSSGGLKKLCYPHYGLEPSTRCVIFRRALNDVYLLSSRDRRYALKVYQSEWRTPEAILSELEALRHVGAKGVEVVQPIARLDGRWITDISAPEGRRSAVLFHWLGGKTPEWTDPAHSAQLGRLSARLHAAADDIPSNATRPQMTIRYLMDESLARIHQALEGAPDLVERCDAIVARSRAWLGRSRMQPEDWGFCHGDLVLNNARIEAGRLVLLDFDWSGFGWRVFDLATFRWASRLFNAEQVAWKPFIESYLDVRPAAARSLPFLRQFMILRHLWHMTQCIRTAELTGECLISDGYLDDLVLQCEQLETDPDLE